MLTLFLEEKSAEVNETPSYKILVLRIVKITTSTPSTKFVAGDVNESDKEVKEASGMKPSEAMAGPGGVEAVASPNHWWWRSHQITMKFKPNDVEITW